MFKYPRTRHIEGSRLGPGDGDLTQVPWADLREAYLVIEEKIDGANAGISFTSEGELRLQSRGHYLTGGAREKHFALFKTWASVHRDTLYDLLGSRYLMFGEWAYAKHTVYYDQLPHYFLEFDIFDQKKNEFLDTERRHELLRSSPIISVPVLTKEYGKHLDVPQSYVKRSLYKSDYWKSRLKNQAESLSIDVERVFHETDYSDDAEGLYIKVEVDGIVHDRLKWVRQSFLHTVVQSESHWLNRPIIPNLLGSGVDIFGDP
jgi:hypothetical protein